MSNKVFTAKLGKVGDFYVVLNAYYDQDTNPADWDEMSEDYLEAYRAGHLSFLNVQVQIIRYGVELGEAWLGGVEYGTLGDWSHWEDEVCEEVLSQHSWLIDDAVAEAKKELANLKACDFAEFSRDVAIGKFSTGELVK